MEYVKKMRQTKTATRAKIIHMTGGSCRTETAGAVLAAGFFALVSLLPKGVLASVSGIDFNEIRHTRCLVGR